MTDPISLATLGGLAATQGIKFLFEQASALLASWREHRDQDAPVSQLPVPIRSSPALDAQPQGRPADAALVEQEHRQLAVLSAALAPYVHGDIEISPDDAALAEHATRLRAVLEAVYHQRFTFVGERREPTGSTVTVRQVLGDVAGQAFGAQADVGAGGSLHIDQQGETVTGSVTGFQGRIGGPLPRSDHEPS